MGNQPPKQKDTSLPMKKEDGKSNLEASPTASHDSDNFEDDIIPEGVKTHQSEDEDARVLSSSREAVGKFVNSDIVEGTILAMIIINGIMIGLSTFDFISENAGVSEVFDIVDMTFLIIFTVELSLHIYHLGFGFLKDGWVLFDFVLVLASWVFNTGSIKAIRALRILRVLPRIEALRQVIRSIVVVMPKMGAVALLLSLIMFIFSIFMTQLFGDIHEEYGTEIDYFSRLDLTLLTLFQLMTLDGWTGVAREVVGIYTWAWVPLFLYIILTGIVVTNIVIAIICESVLYIDEDENENENEEQVLNLKMRQMQEEIMALRNQIEKKVYPDMQDNESRRPSSRFLTSRGTVSFGIVTSDDASEDISVFKDRPSDDESSFSLNLPPGGLRERCGKFVNSKPVNAFIITLIVINSILMAIATFSFVMDDPPTLAAFDTVDMVLLIIYTVESFLQVVYHGFYIYKDGWASFDLFLVVLSWSMSFTNIPVQAARSLRIIRILRLVPKLKSLRIIIVAVFRVLPKLGGIAAILLLLFYIFAIIMTVLFKDYELKDSFFTRLDTTMFTLFQIMTMADWSPIARELMVHVTWAPLPIIIFLVVSGFIFLNLIIALICEAMNAIEELREEGFDEDSDELDDEIRRSTSQKSIQVSSTARLEYIAQTQKEIQFLLQSCTIVPNK